MKIKKCVLALIVAAAIMAGFTLGASSANVRQTVTATVCPDLNIEVDGAKKSLKDAAGNPVYPIVYKGSTYVPLRAIGDLLGVGVDWDQDTQTAKYITDGKPAGTDNPVTKGVDFIDDIEAISPYNIKIVQTPKGEQIQVANRVLDHWMRCSLWGTPGINGCEAFYNLSGDYKTLTMTLYSNYDVSVNVYNNKTRDVLLGNVEVKANADPITHTFQINNAVQLTLDVTKDNRYADGSKHFLYIYDAYLQ